MWKLTIGKIYVFHFHKAVPGRFLWLKIVQVVTQYELLRKEDFMLNFDRTYNQEEEKKTTTKCYTKFSS